MGLLKFINELCLDQVTVNHLISRGHVELMAFPAGLLRDRCDVQKNKKTKQNIKTMNIS